MNIKITLLLSSLFVLASAHIVALEFFLYWKYLWFDIPMHILGGLCVALGFSSLPFFHINLPTWCGTIISYTIVVFLVGIAWEVFEVVFDLVIFDETYNTDTFIDLCMDMLGGFIGYGIVKGIKPLE